MIYEEALRSYARLVREWAPRLDLVAPDDLGRFEERHIQDCLRAENLLRSSIAGPCIDVGTGAGLPGVVLAIVDPTRHWRLAEPRQRKAAFLEEVVRELDLDCEVTTLSAEAASLHPGFAARHAFATARALAPPARAFALLEPLVAAGGTAAVFVGPTTKLPPQAELWAKGIAILRKQ